VTLADHFCDLCGRQLASGHALACGCCAARHWDGPMPLSVKAGIAWLIVVPGGVVALAVWLAIEVAR
jgi:hypothetical protein